MPSSTLRNATDAWTDSAQASKNYADSRVLRIRSTNRYAFLFFNRAAPLGATIQTGTLRVYYAAAKAASSTLTVRRIATGWKVSRLRWNNQPGVIGGTVTATLPAGPAGTVVEVDVKSLLQEVSNGSPWHGFRLSQSSATDLPLGSTQGTSAERPTMDVSWSEAPDAPTTLRPDAGNAVATQKPVLRFDFTDHLGDTTLDAVQVQVSTVATFATTVLDTGWVLTTDDQLDLDDTAYTGLPVDGTVRYWRVRVRDGAGLISEWSDAASMRYVVLGTVTITNPAAEPGNVVHEPTPPFLWTYSGVQAAWQVLVRDGADPSLILANSGKVLGTEQSWTPPPNVLTGMGTYRVDVRVWDNVDREATPDAADYATANRVFTVTSDATVTGVTGLTATQPISGRPMVRLEWTRADAPDKYVIRRDQTVIEGELLPGDALTTGTTYQWHDDAPGPWRPHTWQVQAVVNGKASPWQQAGLTPQSRGLWLLDSDQDLAVWLAGEEGGSIGLGEDASVFTPVGSTHVVRRIQQQRGYSGTLSGLLVDRADLTALQSETALLAMRQQPTRPVGLVMGDLALRVWIGEVSIYPTPKGIPPQRAASFAFWEAP